VSPHEIDYADVQGLVRFGHGKLSEATYALLRVKQPEAARAWLRSAPVTSATPTSPPPTTATQVAFTAAGLEALGVPAAVRAGFSPEFLSGITEESRSRRLGDVGANAPSLWEWGGPAATPHVLVAFFSAPGGLAAFVQAHTGEAWKDGFEAQRWLETSQLDGIEPFGFADGISQPDLDWVQTRDLKAARNAYANAVALGEFLLGYRNEYDKYTDRPLLEVDARSAGLLPAVDAPDKKDLGRNGTYLVIRQLRQDVGTFWRFLNRQAGGDRARADELAAAFVGRTKAGVPLAAMRPAAGPGAPSKPEALRLNEFSFDDDPAGVRCPIGAHVRRANPRNTDYAGRPTGLARLIADLGFGRKVFREDLTSAVRFHRILRRGREYGPGLSPQDAVALDPPDARERGLHFICLNANIGRQFEFLQNAWMSSLKFAGLSWESDPLVGTREPVPGCPMSDAFTLPRESGPARVVTGLPRFVTVRGGAYFFLPSLRALRYVAGA
jgi:deferrochelatase/peroxidase EfeB